MIIPIEKFNEDNIREGIPEAFFGAKIKSIVLDENVLENQRKGKILKDWACKPPCVGNLLFHGAPGRGKTYAAIALMYFLEKFDKIPWHEMRFVNIAELNQQWLANFGNYSENYARLTFLKSVKVVVFDDLGLRKPSEGFLDFLHCLIDARVNSPALINIYTTNLTGKEFNDLLGPRLVSRISGGVKIEFKSKDFRQMNTKD